MNRTKKVELLNTMSRHSKELRELIWEFGQLAGRDLKNEELNDLIECLGESTALEMRFEKMAKAVQHDIMQRPTIVQ